MFTIDALNISVFCSMDRANSKIFIFLISISGLFIMNCKKSNHFYGYSTGGSPVYIDTYLDMDKGKLQYHPINIIDRTSNSWCEGANDDGTGTRIDIRFAKSKDNKIPEINYFYIKNGFGKKDYYEANNRVKDITVSGYHVNPTRKFSERVTLKDTPDFQKVTLNSTFDFSSITIKIDSVYPGSKYNDTCITEISFKENDRLHDDEKPGVPPFTGVYPHDFYKLKIIVEPDGKLYSANHTVTFNEETAPGNTVACTYTFIEGKWIKANFENVQGDYYGEFNINKTCPGIQKIMNSGIQIREGGKSFYE